MLSTAAFNAFLKTLEEPPHHAIFILATTEKHKLLPTILSRCQIYDFQRITIEDIVEHLRYVASQEGFTVDDDALNVIARKADGGMRDALSIFDQVAASSGGNITYQTTIENLNILDYDYYFRLTDALLDGNVPEALLVFDSVLRAGFGAQLFVNGLSSHFRDLMVSKDAATLPLLDVGTAVAEQYARQAERCDKAFLYKAMDLSNRCDLDYRISNNKRLLVELMLIKICSLGMPQEIGRSSEARILSTPSTPAANPRPAVSPTTAQTNKSVVEAAAQSPSAASEPQQEQTGPAIPEPGDVVVSFDKINELMAEKRQNARAEVEKAETPETPQPANTEEPKKPRRGRPPKAEKAATENQKAEKSAWARKGRPPKADKAAPGEATPTKRDKLVCSQ